MAVSRNPEDPVKINVTAVLLSHDLFEWQIENIIIASYEFIIHKCGSSLSVFYLFWGIYGVDV